MQLFPFGIRRRVWQYTSLTRNNSPDLKRLYECISPRFIDNEYECIIILSTHGFEDIVRHSDLPAQKKTQI